MFPLLIKLILLNSFLADLLYACHTFFWDPFLKKNHNGRDHFGWVHLSKSSHSNKIPKVCMKP